MIKSTLQLVRGGEVVVNAALFCNQLSTSRALSLLYKCLTWRLTMQCNAVQSKRLTNSLDLTRHKMFEMFEGLTVLQEL